MNTFAVPCSDDVTPQDIAAIEKVLQHIDHQNLKKAVLGPLANWFLALKIFKEIEIRYALMSDRTTIEQPHRAVLAGLMGIGEGFLAALDGLKDQDLKSIGVSKQAVAASLRYLRMKYEQWYGVRDSRQVAETLKVFEGDDAAATAR